MLLTSPASAARDRRLFVAVLAFAATVVLLAVAPAASRADACTAPVTNPVACENTKPGTDPSDWQLSGYGDAGDESIQGYATQMSVQPGDTIGFKIKSETTNFHIDILRLGYYGGDGARTWASNLRPTGPSTQPACQEFSATGLVDCGNWGVTRTWAVPTNAVSGVYIAHLVRDDTGGDSHIIFVVRDDSSHSDVVLQTSDETWQAYNNYGGNSLYSCTTSCPPGDPLGYKSAYKVSYNRPIDRTELATSFFGGAEYAMVRFLEANGYNVSYMSGVDASARGSLIKNHKLFISSGHDEYWSGPQRTAVESARDAGVNLAFFSGNEVFWRTRFEPSSDGSNTANRTLVAYKDTHFSERQDPVEWTGTWRDPRYKTDSELQSILPENSLTGQTFEINSGSSNITVPYAYRQLRMWRNTAVASQTNPSGSVGLAPDTLGIEWDIDADNDFRPAGSIQLSSTTVSNLEIFNDYGSTTHFGGVDTHNLTLYKAPSGARVFGAGTIQWAFGLDSNTRVGNPVDRNMQQATVNLFADMGVQPSSLISGLVAATKTTDTAAPTVSITSLPSSAADGSTVTISGAASDTGGGVVAGVEVSTDDGSTWRRASGTTSWSYSWTVHGAPTTKVRVRASDDSANVSAPTTGQTVTVNCPCSMWSPTTTPAIIDGGDPSAAELAFKFTTDTYGTVSGIKFYKASTNTGTHSGSLWTASGQRLAQATFTNESASGWQSVTFAEPVDIQPGTVYLASYYAPNGHYSATSNYFYANPAPGPNGGGVQDSGPLHAVRNKGTTTNGLYAYGSSSTLPISSFGAANYWVDVMFSPTPIPGQVTGVTAAEGGRTSANVTWTPPASGGTVTSYEVTPFVGSTAQTPKTVSGTSTSTTVTGLTTGTTYTFKVQAKNPNGSGPLSAASNAVTPSGPVVPAAPTNVAAKPATSSAQVTWTLPDSDGDSPLTGQTVTPYIGSTAQTPVQVGASATSTTFTGLTNGTSYTFKVTATNGVGTSAASAASNAVVPQATIFDFQSAGGIDIPSGASVELGVKFKADYDGSITGVRFYKGAGNTGTHIGSLWTASGTRLAQATFTKETSSGWQAVTFSSPVAVTAGTTYVASYFSPGGGFTAVPGGLESAVDNGALHTIPNATSPNGVYAYGGSSTFPTLTYNGANYLVDVMYALPAPGTPTGVSAAAGGTTSANVTWTAPASGGPVTGYVITPYIGSTPQTAKIKNVSGASTTSAAVTGLSTGTTYTFAVQATNQNGPGAESTKSNAVTPLAAVVPMPPTNVVARPATKSARVTWDLSTANGDSAITGQTVTPYVGSTAQTPVQVGASTTTATITGLDNGTTYTFKVTATNGVGTSPASDASNAVTPEATILDFATPTTTDSGDSLPVELGVKFQADFAGAVTGIRFYKSAANTGTHVGSLWTASGTRLAQATFTNETGSGWQTATFSSPVTLTPGTTYVASYFAPNGHYSLDANGLSSGIDNAPLHALPSTTSQNGVYAYGPSGGFPSNHYAPSNYYVDVLYAPEGAPGAPTGVTATAGNASATVSWTAPASGGPVTSYKITPYIGSTAQTTKTITGNPPATTTTVSGLTPGTAYTFRVTASNPTGDGPQSAASAAVTPSGAAVPGAPTGVTAVGDSSAAIVGWTAPSSDGGASISGYTVTPFIGGTPQTPTQVSGSTTATRITGLTNGTGYTFSVAATNSAGTSAASSASAAVTPRASIFESGTPAAVDGGDTGSVMVGVKFTSDVAGKITGLRFYKAAANTGTHIGTLWDSTGTSLAQAAFTTESATGWQAVTFATPVDIAAGTTYVASYLAPSGHYSLTASAFHPLGVDNTPLHALANPVSQNGVYTYSATPAFPTSSFNASNYWVDVLFAPNP